MKRLNDILKAIFFIILILQFTPPLVETIRKHYHNLVEPRTKVAILEIKDIINSSAYYTHHLKSFFENPEVKAIILKINSGGGAAGSGQAIFNEIKLLQKQHPKTIITISENILGSAAYHVAAATDWVLCSPSTIVGSIGGYLPHQFKLKDFAERWKIRVELISAGKYKSVGDPFIETTPEQQQLLQSIADDAYIQFTSDIADARKLPLNKSDEWGDGKIFTGNQALKMGLVDEVGSWSNLLTRLKEKALIEGKIDWITPPHKSPLAEFLGMGSDHEAHEEQSTFYQKCAHAVIQELENKSLNRIG